MAEPHGATSGCPLPPPGFGGVRCVGVGKCSRLTIEAVDEAAARTEVDELCARFLANPVIEDSDIRVDEVVRR